MLDLNAETIAAIERYARKACGRLGIPDTNALNDITQDGLVAALVALGCYDKNKDKNQRGLAHFARVRGSYGVKRSAKRHVETQTLQRSNSDGNGLPS